MARPDVREDDGDDDRPHGAVDLRAVEGHARPQYPEGVDDDPATSVPRCPDRPRTGLPLWARLAALITVGKLLTVDLAKIRRAGATEREERTRMICRRFLSEDKEAVLSLLVEAFDGWHGDKNEAYWAWKFERNPHGSARIYVCDDDGQIAGCYMLMPMVIRVGEATTLGVQAVDAAVSRDYRGRGVFTHLAQMGLKEAVDDGVGMIFAFPSKGAFGGQVKAGFKPKMVIPKAYRPLPWPPRHKHYRGFTLRDVDTFDSGFGALDRAASHREIRVERDDDFLRWRYCQHPTKSYKTVTCERDGEICGYLVLTLFDTGGRGTVGYIVDLQTLPGCRPAATLLVNDALRRLWSLGARVAMSWERPSGDEQEALKSAGFSSKYGQIRRLVTRPDYVDQLIAFDAANSASGEHVAGGNSVPWSLVPGDADYS